MHQTGIQELTSVYSPDSAFINDDFFSCEEEFLILLRIVSYRDFKLTLAFMLFLSDKCHNRSVRNSLNKTFKLSFNEF